MAFYREYITKKRLVYWHKCNIWFPKVPFRNYEFHTYGQNIDISVNSNAFGVNSVSLIYI